MTRFAKFAILLAALVAIPCNLAMAADVTSTYSGSSANWTTAAWVNAPPLGGYPNNGNAGVATYDAVFNDGFSGDGPLTLDQNITIQKFTLNLGTLTGTFNLTTNDVLHDTGGTMSGTGITTANAGMQIDGFVNRFDTRTINVAGSSSFTGDAGDQSGNLYWNNAATLNNSGTFDAGWSLNFNNNIGSTVGSSDSFGTFNNSGTFTRSVGTGATTVSIPFNNSHIVTVQAGTLLLNGGGTESGSFQAGTGATLNFGGSGTTLAAGSSLSGPGTTIISGTVSVTGPAVTYSGGGTLQVTGILNGAGTLTATAPVELSAGTMSGTGVTNTNGGLSIDGYPNFLDTRTLNNGGTATFTGTTAGLLYVYNGAIINNSGTFDAGWAANNSNTISPNGTSGTFNNSGTFTRSVGTGMTTINIPFNNSHIVTVQAGTLSLNGGGTESGSFQVATGAVLNIGGSGITLAAGSSLSGPGTIVIPQSQTVTVTAPALTFSGGGNLQVIGTLDGAGTLTATAPLELSAGTMSGTGITNANSGLSIDGYPNFLDTRTLNNGGTATFTGTTAGLLYVYNGATINNTGTFDAGWAVNNSNTISPNGTSGTFNNSGTFTRSVGTGMTTINIPFNNSHIVTVQAGTLVLNGGGMETGSFQVASGAVLNFAASSTTLAAGSSLSGPGTTIVSGTVSVTGSAVTFGGGGTLQVTTMLSGAGILNGAGTLTATAPLELSAGTMSGTGITNANGGLSIDGYPNFLDTRTLNNGGTATFTGTTAGLLYVYNGATINNTGTFDAGWAANNSNTISPNGTSGTFNNSGTFTRSVGTGMTTINIPFNNSHIVTVQAGTLSLNGGGTESGSFQVATGAVLNIGGSGITLAAGSSLSGPGTIVIPQSQTVTVTAPALTFSGGGNLQVIGTLDGAGTLTATAPLELSAGTMSGTGITNANGGLSIDGYPNFLDTRTLNNGGTATFTGTTAGLLYVYNGATINNTGTFDAGWAVNNSNTISPNGTSGTFNNSGTFTRSVGTGMTTINIPFANTGTVDVKAGTLEFDSSLSIGDNSSLKVSGGTLKININSGAASVGSGSTASISGTGTLELASSVSALGVASPAADRVAISNTSTAAAGLLISGGNQEVGAISGSGTVQVNSGTSLTADSIVAGALLIGGAPGIPARVTIDASDSDGQPLDEGLTNAEIQNPIPVSELPASVLATLPLALSPDGSSISLESFIRSAARLDDSAVPEPSTITLLAIAIAGSAAFGFRRQQSATTGRRSRPVPKRDAV